MNPVVEFFKTQIGLEITETPSGVGKWLRGTLRAVEAGKLEADFTVRPEMTNPGNMLHGGMISLVSDEMIGAAVATLNLSSFYVSVSLNTEFLLGAKEGDIIRAKSYIVKQGSTLINAACELYNAQNNLIAKSSSNLISTKK